MDKEIIRKAIKNGTKLQTDDIVTMQEIIALAKDLGYYTGGAERNVGKFNTIQFTDKYNYKWEQSDLETETKKTIDELLKEKFDLKYLFDNNERIKEIAICNDDDCEYYTEDIFRRTTFEKGNIEFDYVNIGGDSILSRFYLSGMETKCLLNLTEIKREAELSVLEYFYLFNRIDNDSNLRTKVSYIIKRDYSDFIEIDYINNYSEYIRSDRFSDINIFNNLEVDACYSLSNLKKEGQKREV